MKHLDTNLSDANGRAGPRLTIYFIPGRFERWDGICNSYRYPKSIFTTGIGVMKCSLFVFWLVKVNSIGSLSLFTQS